MCVCGGGGGIDIKLNKSETQQFFASCIYFLNIFGFNVLDFMFCSTANAILGQVLSMVSCGSLEYCGLASKYVLNI